VSERTHLPRGLVTFLFTDIEGSTRLAQMLGSGYPPVLNEHRRLLRGTLASCAGTPLFAEGDSLFVAFPDAGAALHACAEAQRALATHDWPTPEARPQVRMGLHTGYAEPLGDEYTTPEVHRAARIAAAAHGGQVLCSASTARHAGQLSEEAWLLDLGLHRLRGFDDRERLFQLIATGLHRQFPRPRTLDAIPHNLPGTVTNFVGRAAEQRELAALVEANRLVTVVGPGGAGKTRLAVEVASTRVDAYPDGVWFVDLASVTDPGLAAVTVAATLGLRPEPGRAVVDTIADYAANRRFLLVLDTCDAQPGATAMLVGRLLSSSRGAEVLATSREPFGLAGEVVWRIPPLSLEPAEDGSPGDAVALLVDRATAARGGQKPTDAELEQLCRVAYRLEGLPLALELAAARLRVLTAKELVTRLDDVVSTLDAGVSMMDTVSLSGGAALRHATLQATVTWSYRTLAPGAARLLRWLAVFADRVDLPTVEWLFGEDPLDALAVLVDKSLVQAEPTASGTTYRMLGPIRAYAARRLAEAGEEQTARDRHVAWSLHAVERAHLGPDRRPVTLSLFAIDPLADELRAALRWTTSQGSARQGLRITGELDHWWRERGLAREGRLWLFRLYERLAVTGEEIPEAELAAAYHMHALHSGADGEYAEELRFSRRAETAARRAGDPALLARVLAGRGTPLLEMGNPAEAETACREVITWAHEQGVIGDALFAVYCLAQILWERGALDEAADLLGAARPVEAGRPAERGRRTVDMILGMVSLARGDLIAAHDHLTVALRSRIGYGFHSRSVETISGFAVRCALGGDPVTGARLFGAAQAARAVLHCSAGLWGPYWARQQVRLREVMGDSAFDRAYAEGAALSLEEAAKVALAVEHPDLEVGSVRFSEVGRLSGAGHPAEATLFPEPGRLTGPADEPVEVHRLIGRAQVPDREDSVATGPAQEPAHDVDSRAS
jgi:predicted ATPase/class 3 adenylate cyclase